VTGESGSAIEKRTIVEKVVGNMKREETGEETCPERNTFSLRINGGGSY